MRDAVAIIDVTSLGKLDLRDRNVPALLERMYVNKWQKLEVGGVRYGAMCADDGVTGRLEENHYLMSTMGVLRRCNLRAGGRRGSIRHVQGPYQGRDVPGRHVGARRPFGRSAWAGDRLVVGSGPDEWLILGPPGRAAEIAAELGDAVRAVSPAPVTVVDLTHGRALVRLSGPETTTLLRRVRAIGLDDRLVPNRTAPPCAPVWPAWSPTWFAMTMRARRRTSCTVSDRADTTFSSRCWPPARITAPSRAVRPGQIIPTATEPSTTDSDDLSKTLFSQLHSPMRCFGR